MINSHYLASDGYERMGNDIYDVSHVSIRTPEKTEKVVLSDMTANGRCMYQQNKIYRKDLEYISPETRMLINIAKAIMQDDS